MSKHDGQAPVARRTFVGRVAAAIAAIGAATATLRAHEPASPAPWGSSWQPARHAEDDWLESTPAKHRFFLDTTKTSGLSDAMAYTRNFLDANASAYKLTDADSAVIICLRHASTPFAFTDAMWAKYPASLSERADYVDPDTKLAPSFNPLNAPGQGLTLDGLAKRGVRYAVCAMATRRIAEAIAGKSGGDVDAIVAELVQHVVPGSHMVPAGIVAVNRAQERGYSFATVV